MAELNVLLDGAAELHAVHDGHHDVGDDEVNVGGANLLEGLLPVGSCLDDEVLAQALADELAYAVLVLDEEDVGAAHVALGEQTGVGQRGRIGQRLLGRCIWCIVGDSGLAEG